MPEALGEAQIDAAIRDAIAASGAASMRDMGKVMSALRDAVQGRADMAVVSARVKALLGAASKARFSDGRFVRVGTDRTREIHCRMAGRIPQSFINDLLTRIDIVDVIDARVTLRKTGRNFQALCPFHDEKTASFSVNPEKQFYYCFGCGATGTALTFLMEHDRLEFVAAVETLASIAGVEVPRERGARTDDELHAPAAEACSRRRTSTFARCCVSTPRRRGSSTI